MARSSRPIFQNIDKAKVEGETLTEAGSGRGEGDQPSVIYLNDALKRHDRFRESENERVKIVRAEIVALDEQELSALLTGLKVQFKLRGMSQSIMQRLQDGK